MRHSKRVVHLLLDSKSLVTVIEIEIGIRIRTWIAHKSAPIH